ncbi:hypothetical protein IG631_01229 [Alternaria alternata]|nr:hypothetical protein IG631_01229 [Alternaria alternata]
MIAMVETRFMSARLCVSHLRSVLSFNYDVVVQRFHIRHRPSFLISPTSTKSLCERTRQTCHGRSTISHDLDDQRVQEWSIPSMTKSAIVRTLFEIT